MDEKRPACRPCSVLQIISRVVFGLAVAWVLGLAANLFFYAVPVWDDLVRATRPVEVGWWNYVYGYVYNHWQGRWASCGLESFILPRLDISRYYWLLLCSVTLVDAIGIYTVCRWFVARKSIYLSTAITAGFLALLWTAMPFTNGRAAIAEAVYWFTGAVENAMVYSLAALVLMALIVIPREATTAKKTLLAIGLCIAAVCVCGFHELYGLMFCIALALGCTAAVVNRDSRLPIWVAVTVAAGLGLLVVMLAPGNSVRAISDGGHHARQINYDLRVALAQVRHFVPHWIRDPKLIGVSLWVLTSKCLKRPANKGPMPWHFAIPFAWMIMLAAGFFAPSWAFGNAMPPRTLAGVYIIFVVGWLLTLWTWSPVLSSLKCCWIDPLACAGLLIFSIGLLLAGTVRSVRSDYHSRILPWHTAMEHRYALLRNAAGTDALIPPLPKPPWNLLDGEIVNDPGDYRNWSTVSFFHLRSVRLFRDDGSAPPPPEKPTHPPAKGMGS